MGNTVVVGCKLPNGMTLRVDGAEVTIKGLNSSNIIGGHGITDNVNAEFMEKWMKENANLTPVKKGFIFVHASKDAVIGEAYTRANEKTGLEGLSANDLPKGVQVDTEAPGKPGAEFNTPKKSKGK